MSTRFKRHKVRRINNTQSIQIDKKAARYHQMEDGRYNSSSSVSQKTSTRPVKKTVPKTGTKIRQNKVAFDDKTETFGWPLDGNLLVSAGTD